MGSGSETYISTPWQSTTSKLPGRKCTPVSRPSPWMIRIRSRMPSGSPVRASRATWSIASSDSRPVTECPARAIRSAWVPWPIPTSSTRSRRPTGKRAAICSSSCRPTSSWRTTLRSPPSPSSHREEAPVKPEVSVLRGVLRA